jgi:ubiquinone/menaquinone biosynthesis C-methylase UbiE
MLASISLADARKLNIASGTADAVLLFGPLYQLAEGLDRMQALGEARRIPKPRGILQYPGTNCRVVVLPSTK